MSRANFSYHNLPDGSSAVVREDTIESGCIVTLQALKHDYRPDITHLAA